MKSFSWLLLLLFPTACDKKETPDVPAVPVSPGSAMDTQDAKKILTKKIVSKKTTDPKGRFTGRFGDKKFDFEVSCRHLDKPYFQLQSDRTQTKDSNGDGVVLFGTEQQKDGSFALSFTDSGEHYSVRSLKSFEKSKTGVKGSGTLATEDDSKKREIEFDVTCP